MKIQNILIFFLLLIIGCSSDPNKPIDIKDLEYNSVQNSYYFKNLIGQSSLFTGNIFEVDGKEEIILEGNLYKGKKDGLFKSYDPTYYTLLSEENYRNGKLDGESLYYNFDGELTEKVNFSNGKRDGITIVYNF